MNYQIAKELFDSAKNKEAGKPIANNTRVVKSGDDYAIRLHSTNVVTFKPGGAIVLDTGGWKTVTTKERFNSYSPARVYSDRGIWRVGSNGHSAVFQDGFTINPDGSFSNCGPEDSTSELKATKKAVSDYARGFIDKLFAGEIQTPSNGDCFYCLMREEKTGKPLGECTRNASHIESHMEEKYFVPSLLVNAMDMFGASIAAKQTAFALMSHQPEHAFSTDRENFIAAAS